MLKWAIGQRTPSSSSSTCSDTTPSANRLKLHATNRQHLKIANKENRRKTCRRSLENEMVKSTSTRRKRDKNGIYLQLDSAIELLDVSNKWSSSCDCDAEHSKCKQLRKSSCRLSHKNRGVSDLISAAVGAVGETDVTGEGNKREATTSERSDTHSVNELETPKEPKMKQLYNLQHDPIVHLWTAVIPPATSLLFDNRQQFTIQTSPPEEPNELFHKELPIKSLRRPNSCDIAPPFVPTPCDLSECVRQPREVSTLAKNYSWLEASNFDANSTVCTNIFERAEETVRESSHYFSTTGTDDSQFTPSNRPISLKHKTTSGNATCCMNEGRAPSAKSKRRCMVFNERSFILNTPARNENLEQQPSSLIRRRTIRRDGRRQKQAGMWQRVHNTNLRSVLTLPHAISTHFEMKNDQYRTLPRTPLSICITRDDDGVNDFDVLKKAASTPKSDCPFDLTEDVFLSPGVGIRPSLDSAIAGSASKIATAVRVTPKSGEDADATICFSSAVHEQPWDSHEQLLSKEAASGENEAANGLEADSTRSSDSSCINDDQDAFSSIALPIPAQISGLTTDRLHQSSRRCLPFTAPSKSRSAVKQSQLETGQLDLRIYYNNGLLTVHVIRARNLDSIVGKSSCNAYVKLNLVPHAASKTFNRTCVRKNSYNPKFDHKFSIEITESDLNKGVLISVWHRDRGKRKSEFLGCMSFAIKNLLKEEINGTYKLLSNNANEFPHISQGQQSQDEVIASRITNYIDERIRQLDTERLCTDHDEFIFLQTLELGHAEPEFSRGRTMYTITHTLIKESDSNYGFTIAWTKPPRVERVDSNSMAKEAGLNPGDIVVFVNKTNVISKSKEEILELIQNCGYHLELEIYRKPSVNESTTPTPVQRIISNKINWCKSIRFHGQSGLYTTTEVPAKILHQLPEIAFSSEVGSGVII